MKVCVLSSGSKGNSTYIETSNHKILIDVGMSCLYIENSLRNIGVDPKSIDIVLITHSHVDHINGLKVFLKKNKSKIYISDEIINEANLQNIEFNRITSLKELKDISISEIKLSHDVKDIKGYIIDDYISSVVYITDTGYINEKYYDMLKNRKMYVFESNHDVELLMNNPKYPHSTKIRILSDKGHLSNKDSSYYLSKLVGANTKYIVLAHLSEQNNTDELALNSLLTTLKKSSKKIPEIGIARQNETSKVFEI